MGFRSFTYQYCHNFRACNGKLQMANVSTTMISIRTTPRRARKTLLLVECPCPPWWWLWLLWWWCLWWKLWVRHVVVTTLSESTDTWKRKCHNSINNFRLQVVSLGRLNPILNFYAVKINNKKTGFFGRKLDFFTNHDFIKINGFKDWNSLYFAALFVSNEIWNKKN